jgi:hypothetical protein
VSRRGRIAVLRGIRRPLAGERDEILRLGLHGIVCLGQLGTTAVA